jgi:lysophospholipase L1-like esterase
VLLCGAAAFFFIHRRFASFKPFSPAIIARSHVSIGNPARLQRVLDKARRGEPVTLGFIGGSITHGQAASSPERSYPNLVGQWWISHFPQSHITMVNAGVGGTGSAYGVLRLQHDLLSKHPDFVVVEFGVNDHDDAAHAETYEGIVRQLLADPDQPAVLLLFMMHHDGTSAQDFQEPIGARYELPMVSYRDALWPEIAAGRLKWSDISEDDIHVHPNDRGHAAAASFIDSMLQETLDHLPAKPPLIPPIPTTMPLPAPVYTDLFGDTQLIGADKLVPVTNSGWIYDNRNQCWASQTPGGVIEFETVGRAFELLYGRFTPDAGTIETTFDDDPAKIFDGWFDGTWEGYTQVDEMGRDPQGGSHRLRVELIGTRNPGSRGYAFRIMGLGVVR